jgi:hypothetical protein
MNVTFGMIATILVYLFITGFLGYLGWKRTKNAADYLVGGRQIHPMIMALSYGARSFRPRLSSDSAVCPRSWSFACYGSHSVTF